MPIPIPILAPLERLEVGVAEAVGDEVADVLPELVDALTLVVEVCVAATKSVRSEL
jgi:hypothetical protein